MSVLGHFFENLLVAARYVQLMSVSFLSPIMTVVCFPKTCNIVMNINVVEGIFGNSGCCDMVRERRRVWLICRRCGRLIREQGVVIKDESDELHRINVTTVV